MSDSSHRDLEAILRRVRDNDEQAIQQLVGRVYDDVLRMAGGIMRRKFPRLLQRHDIESVAHEALGDLIGDLRRIPPLNVAALFSYIASRIRWVLLDLSKRKELLLTGLQPADSSASPLDHAQDSTHDGARLAQWTELHRKVGELPDEERLIFELHFYCGLTQAQIAEELQKSPKEVSRLWLSALSELAQVLDL